MNLENKAKAFATNAHNGQFRRDGITPYINHPEKVASMMDTDEEKAVAWLHDVLEDTTVTADDLSKEFPSHIVSCVQKLTKSNAPYLDYLYTVSEWGITKRVKMADMLSNLTDDPTPKQVQKYTEGIMYLYSAKKHNPNVAIEEWESTPVAEKYDYVYRVPSRLQPEFCKDFCNQKILECLAFEQSY